MPLIEFQCKDRPDYECGAALLTYLAYPDLTKDDGRRADLHASLCAEALRSRYPLDGDAWNSLVPMKPVHAFRALEAIDKDVKRLKRLFRDRMVAARMVMGYLQEAFTGAPAKLPPGVKHLSINQMAELVLDNAGQAEVKNVVSRVWSPSRPVCHIAAAIAVMINDEERAGRPGFDYRDLANDFWRAKRVVEQAEGYEELLLRSPQLAIDPAKLIRLRLAPG